MIGKCTSYNRQLGEFHSLKVRGCVIISYYSKISQETAVRTTEFMTKYRKSINLTKKPFYPSNLSKVCILGGFKLTDW